VAKRPAARADVTWILGLRRAPPTGKHGRMSGEEHAPVIAPMVVLGGIMIATYVVIAFEVLHKSIAAMAGAIAAVVAGLVFGIFHARPGESAYKAVHHMIGHDLGVLGVIIGTSILVEIAGRSGLFHFIAVKIVKQTRGEPRRLLLFVSLATMLFVTFLTIAPGTLIMISLVLVVTKEIDIDAKPYALAVAVIANSAALMTFASGICTLMLGTAGRLPYLQFFQVSTPLAFLSALVAFLVLRRWYARSLVPSGDPAERERKVAAFDEWALVKDRRLFFRCAMILGGTIVGFASAQKLGVGLDLIAMAGGTAALLFSGISAEEAIKKVNWSVILFFVGLFVVIGAVQESGLLGKLAGGIVSLAGGSALATMMIMAAFVLALSGVVDNIPVAATLIPIVRAMEAQGIPGEPMWWALIISANLGGNSTPVGSISTVIALHALEKERHVKVGWGEFLKVGGAITALQSALALGYLYLFARLDLFPLRP
jgi:Na+/H+ antiporter NhaD/arsenite permease-like protein